MPESSVVNGRQLSRVLATVGRESWLLFIAFSFANGSNYLFHVGISRTLGPSDYGALGSILAVLTVLSIPLTAIQATVARRISSRVRGQRSMEWRGLLTALTPYALALSILFALLSPLLTDLLRLNSMAIGFWVAAYLTPAILNSVLRGVLQGRLQFGRLGLVTLFPVLLRLTLGLVAVRAGLGVEGAVAASALSESAGLAFGLLVVGRTEPGEHKLPVRSFLREVAPVGMGLTAMWVLIELDLVLARHFLPAEEAGEYAAAGLLARAVLFVPGAISMIALPHFSRHGGRGNDAYRWLVGSCTIVVVLGTITAVALVWAGDFIVGLTFGSGFGGAGSLLPTLSLGMMGLGIINVLIYFHVAAGARTYNLLWLGSPALVLSVWIFHGSGDEIALVVLTLAWVVALLGFVVTKSMALSVPGADRLPADVRVYPHVPSEAGSPELSLVVPSHRAGSQLAESISTLVGALDEFGTTYEVIVVCDGTTDGFDHVVNDARNTVSVLHYPKQEGKGVALRVGMARARGQYVAFIDSDGELDAAEFKNFFTLMDLYHPDLVIGSKRHPLSRVDYPTTRRVLSWAYHHIVRLFFGLNVSDTQTGMKLIRRDVLDAVLPRMLEKRFAFDLEFLVVARRLGYTRVFEAPIRLNYRFGSTVSLGAAFRILLDTAAIFYRRYILQFYDQPPTSITLDDQPTVHLGETEALRQRVQ
jgi:O-antigen/teichoic acid export membrane protein